MADRGFKHLETLLIKQKCVLVRPATVRSSERSTRNEVIQTRKIAALRIRVERAIRSVREFKFLAPHSCVEPSLISLVDDAVFVACGLVSMQCSLI